MFDPKAFISYAWTSPAHIKWVEDLGSDLVAAGVQVQLDQWHLKPGHDAAHFMEGIIRDRTVTHVIMVCDANYKQKADNRKAGAGIEAQIITQELYSSTENSKYVAILREKDDQGLATIPLFAGNRIYIDFSDDSNYAASLEELIRWIYQKPLKSPPPLGSRPAWLDEDFSATSPTRLPALSAVQAVKRAERHLIPTLVKYFRVLSDQVSLIPNLNMRSSTVQAEALNIVSNFIAFRDEYLQVIDTLATYSTDESAYQTVHTFFENLTTACLPRPDVNTYFPNEWDHKRFLAYEMFVLAVATFIRHSRWDALSTLVHQDYVFSSSNHGRGASSAYTFFYHDNRVFRSSSGAPTPLSDLVFSRPNVVVTNSEIMQADLLLYLVCKLTLDQQSRGIWYPECYAKSAWNSTNFPIFLRAKSRSYFGKFKAVLGVSSPAEFKAKISVIDGEGGPFRGLISVGLFGSVGSSIEVDDIGKNP